MGYPLKQSSTAQPLVFLLVLSSDHLTGATGLSPTVTLSKSGAAFGAPSGAVTEIGNGWYKVAGNATDTGTLGPLLLHATASTADPTDDRFEVVAFDPQSATNLGLSGLPTASPGASTGLAVCNTSGNVPSDLQTIKSEAVTCAAPVTVPATISSYAGTSQTGDAYAYLGTNMGANGANLTGIWAMLSSALTTANSIGKKLASLLLGSDSGVQLSATQSLYAPATAAGLTSAVSTLESYVSANCALASYWTVDLAEQLAANCDVAISSRMSALNEVQKATFSPAPAVGTYTLTYASDPALTLNWNDPAATIQAALESSPSIGSGNVLVTGSADAGTITLAFRGALGNSDVQALVCDATALLGQGTIGVVSETTPGIAEWDLAWTTPAYGSVGGVDLGEALSIYLPAGVSTYTAALIQSALRVYTGDSTITVTGSVTDTGTQSGNGDELYTGSFAIFYGAASATHFTSLDSFSSGLFEADDMTVAALDANGPGAGGTAEVQVIPEPVASGGVFTLSEGVDTSSGIPFDASVGIVSGDLNGFTSIIAAGGVGVSGTDGGPWIVTWNTVGPQSVLTVDGSALTVDDIVATVTTTTQGGTPATHADATAIESAITTLSSSVATVGSGVADIQSLTDSLVHTGGKLWVLDGSGNAVATASAIAALPDASAIASASATAILVTPGHKLATDVSGNVAANNLPGDYQQRGVAVTLPANPPTGFLVQASYDTAPAWITTAITGLQSHGDTDWATATSTIVAGYASGQDPATLLTTYFPLVKLTIDSADSQDIYTVRWLKNMQPATATSPTIQVIREDGTTLIASTAMTQIGSTGAFIYTASGSARTTKGQPVEVIMSATIDGSTRTEKVPAGRDS